MGDSPKGPKELDTIERLTHTHTRTHTHTYILEDCKGTSLHSPLGGVKLGSEKREFQVH